MKTEEFVLIVEDDKDWRGIIKSLVKKNFGLNCKTTKNYQSSMRVLKSALPLAIILDLNLGNSKFNESNWGGWRLAETAKNKRIPIIVVTGYPRDDRIVRALKDYKVLDFFDKKHLADRTPDFIKDIEDILYKEKRRKTRTSRRNGNRINKKPETQNLFISYSHKNRNWLDKFAPHLKVLADNNQLISWDDTKIKSGTKWRDELQNALLNANIALLLVTPDFLASDFIMNVELPELYKAVEERKLTILWVAVMPSLYETTSISELQSANDPSRPLSGLTTAKAQREIVQICKKILEAMK